MSLKKTHKASAVRIAVIAAMGAMTMSAQAQTAPPAQLERIEITGSSIKRIASEGSLPVQIVSAKEIARSGATSVAEVLQKLPAMQGFQIADIAVGSNSGGIVTASIHDIGASYTLVLLNGRRVAPTGSGSTVNLNSIPMSAIDRIEILTDGASALYGSDAIAGVVNFVLKKNQQGGNITASGMVPTEGGGKSGYVSATYGIGDIDKDRFNVLMSYRHDEQKQLKATDRDFGSTAYLPFEFNGKNYIYDRTSSSAVPANATVTFLKGAIDPATGKAFPSYGFNPFQKKTGACAAGNFYSLSNTATATSVTQLCAFDFVKTIEIFPENKRDSLFLTGQFKVNDQLRFFSDVALSRFDLTARIAANPVPVAISKTSSYFTDYIKPYLTPAQLANVNTVTAAYRAQDFGTRDSQTITDSKHFVIGAEAELAGWNMESGLTWSRNSIDERYVGGYFKTNEFLALRDGGKFDPFVESGNQSAATMALIQDSIYLGNVRKSETTMTGVDFRASRELFKLPAGDVALGMGGDLRNMKYTQTPSAAAVNGDIYNYAAVAPYDLERKSGGVFAELQIPVIKNLEFNAALRYDKTDAIKDSVANKTVGESMSSSTYKVSARYQALPQLLFRGSYGTGFKVPSMLDLAQPLTAAGVTAAKQPCPFPGTDACKPATTEQYSVLSGGNEKLKPETSKGGTFGIRFEPNVAFGIGADYWSVKLKDAVSAVSENQAFGNPAKYGNLFTTYKTSQEPQAYYAFIESSTNIGQQNTSGIDWDITGRANLDIGRLTLGLAGTYLIESEYTRPGTDNDFTNNMNKYGENAAVSSRNIYRATASLESGSFVNTFTLSGRDGYADKANSTVRNVATGKNEAVTLSVPRYFTFDWQGVYNYNKSFQLTAGVKNLFNSEPPLTLRDSSGHQVGYDPRYSDVLLRRVYLTGSYSF
ncbi:MAG: TonB-dependent receptor [Paucibacter sp.]|nr:TonB-dependent receptor [Roseateles sp.]